MSDQDSGKISVAEALVEAMKNVMNMDINLHPEDILLNEDGTSEEVLSDRIIESVMSILVNGTTDTYNKVADMYIERLQQLFEMFPGRLPLDDSVEGNHLNGLFEKHLHKKRLTSLMKDASNHEHQGKFIIKCTLDNFILPSIALVILMAICESDELETLSENIRELKMGSREYMKMLEDLNEEVDKTSKDDVQDESQTVILDDKFTELHDSIMKKRGEIQNLYNENIMVKISDVFNIIGESRTTATKKLTEAITMTYNLFHFDPLMASYNIDLDIIDEQALLTDLRKELPEVSDEDIRKEHLPKKLKEICVDYSASIINTSRSKEFIAKDTLEPIIDSDAALPFVYAVRMGDLYGNSPFATSRLSDRVITKSLAKMFIMRDQPIPAGHQV